jgi:hypothetical protein
MIHLPEAPMIMAEGKVVAPANGYFVDFSDHLTSGFQRHRSLCDFAQAVPELLLCSRAGFDVHVVFGRDRLGVPGLALRTLRQNICELKGTGGGYTVSNSDSSSCSRRRPASLGFSRKNMCEKLKGTGGGYAAESSDAFCCVP